MSSRESNDFNRWSVNIERNPSESLVKFIKYSLPKVLALHVVGES